MKLCDIEMQIHIETPDAIFASDDGDRCNAKWLHKSKIKIDRDPGATKVVVTMPEWLALEKGLI